MATTSEPTTETTDPAGLAAGADESTEALLAELEAEQGGAVKPAGKPAKGKAAPAEDDDADEIDADLEEVDEDAGKLDEDLEDDEGDDLEDEADDADDLADKAKADPELAKRLAAVRKTEQRQRQALERDRAAFDRERTDWQGQAKQLTEAQQRFQQLAARAKYDPTSVLIALGVAEDDLEAVAQHVYARSKAPAVKPEHRAAADRAMKEREHADDLARTRAELQELKEGLSKREQEAAEQAEVTMYLGRITKVAASDKLEAPLVKARLAANPKAARNALAVTAYRLAQKLGERPAPAAVIRAHERELQQLRRELGADAPAAATGGASKPAAKPAAKPAKGAKPALAVVVDDDDTTGEVQHPGRDELLRELRSGAS